MVNPFTVVPNPAHHSVEVGAPFYSERVVPDGAVVGAPVFHKYDKPDFVTRFLSDLATASTTSEKPASLLTPLSSTIDPDVPAYDVDATDFLGARFRKLYQPIHFRFYLAACELRCLVPGYPGPERKKVKKVELVVRRVAIKKNDAGAPTIEREKEWAWAKIPDPSVFPEDPPEVTLQMAARLTGNTHTWWPIPAGESQLTDEQRFPMTRASTPGLDTSHAIYYAFCPLGSGDMYGPKKEPTATNPSGRNPSDDVGYSQTSGAGKLTWPPTGFTPSSGDPATPASLPTAPAEQPDPGTPPAPLTVAQVKPATPLVKAPSSYALTPRMMRAWRRNFMKTLGLFSNNTLDGPRPKFEAPPMTGTPDGGWGYVVRCVATVEVSPGCTVEQWGAASEPIVIAPHFDPFGGRPVQIEIPSLSGLKKMLGDLSAAQVAKRGGTPVAMRQPGEQPIIGGDPPEVSGHMALNMICSFGIPLITICAYLMLSIALILLFPLKIAFSFLFSLKFCIPIPVPEQED
jgi:hypothetical protein